MTGCGPSLQAGLRLPAFLLPLLLPALSTLALPTDLLSTNMMRYPTYEHILAYREQHQNNGRLAAPLLRTKRQSIKAASTKNHGCQVLSKIRKLKYISVSRYSGLSQTISFCTPCHRSMCKACQGSNGAAVVELDDTEHFHGPDVLIPDVSFRDMDSFVREAQKTVEDRLDTEQLNSAVHYSNAGLRRWRKKYTAAVPAR